MADSAAAEQHPALALPDRPGGSAVEEPAFPAVDTWAAVAEAQHSALVAEAERGDFAADYSQAAAASHLDADWTVSVQTPAGFAAEPDSAAAADQAGAAADSWAAGCWAADNSAA